MQQLMQKLRNARNAKLRNAKTTKCLRNAMATKCKSKAMHNKYESLRSGVAGIGLISGRG